MAEGGNSVTESRRPDLENGELTIPDNNDPNIIVPDLNEVLVSAPILAEAGQSHDNTQEHGESSSPDVSHIFRPRSSKLAQVVRTPQAVRWALSRECPMKM